MDFSAITNLVTVARTYARVHRPAMLFGAAITSTAATGLFAAKAGYDAGKRVTLAENPSIDPEAPENPLTKREKFDLTYDLYITPAVVGVSAIGLTTGLHYSHIKDKQALAQAALAAIDQVKQDAKDFEAKNLGVVSSAERDEVLANRTGDDLEAPSLVEHSDGTIEEMYLVRDNKTGRDIWSNKARIEEAVNRVNECLVRQGDCELNTFYSLAGFAETPDGDDWGWSGDFLELNWDTTVRDDGRPVSRFTFRTTPQPESVRSRR